jgi:hypothetical protein
LRIQAARLVVQPSRKPLTVNQEGLWSLSKLRAAFRTPFIGEITSGRSAGRLSLAISVLGQAGIWAEFYKKSVIFQLVITMQYLHPTRPAINLNSLDEIFLF